MSRRPVERGTWAFAPRRLPGSAGARSRRKVPEPHARANTRRCWIREQPRVFLSRPLAGQIGLARGDPAGGMFAEKEDARLRHARGFGVHRPEVGDTHRVGHAARGEGIAQPIEILPPIQIAVHEHVLRMIAGERVEVRQMIRMCANDDQHRRGEQHDRGDVSGDTRALPVQLRYTLSADDGEERIDRQHQPHANVHFHVQTHRENRHCRDERSRRAPITIAA
jgi:hypothetical protein